jgi:hypothetical protein
MLPLIALVAADLLIRVSPEPLAVTRRYGNIREMGTWRAAVCAESENPIRISALRLEMAIEHLSVIDPDAAAEVLRARGGERRRVKVARALGIAAVTATGLIAGGYIGVSARQAGLVGLGIQAAGELRGKMEQAMVLFDPAKLLTGQIELAPGECTSRVVFAALVPRSELRPREYRLQLAPHLHAWRRPPIPGITSLP